MTDGQMMACEEQEARDEERGRDPATVFYVTNVKWYEGDGGDEPRQKGPLSRALEDLRRVWGSVTAEDYQAVKDARDGPPGWRDEE